MNDNIEDGNDGYSSDNNKTLNTAMINKLLLQSRTIPQGCQSQNSKKQKFWQKDIFLIVSPAPLLRKYNNSSNMTVRQMQLYTYLKIHNCKMPI